ncbi:UNVERIFIED_CONTAM: hypothetical protein FKN15_054733 [Acipenser sinensis]
MSLLESEEEPAYRLYFYSTSFQRSNSHDKVRKIVAEEGRSARNLIAWSVPLESKEDGGKAKPQVPSSLRSQRITAGLHRNKKQNASLDSKTAAVVLEKNAEKSPSKARQPRKVDLRARYWAFLFDNLRRAVDEIYVTCESDQSVVECKEVLMMLDNYVRDFKALIDWIQLQEKLEKTDALNRGPPPTLSASRLNPTGSSWADKFKSAHTATAANRTGSRLCQPASQNTLRKPAEKHGQKGKKDAEGWKTVQRGRPARPRSAVMVAKMTAAPAPQSPKDDSDKENTQRGPAEVYPDREQLDLEKRRTTELTEEKLDTQTEDTMQFTADSPEDSEKSGSLPLQEISREPWAETPEVHTDAVCPSEGLRVEVAPAASGTDQTPIETVKLESELDPTELSNASIGSGSICGLALDWNEVLADYEAREPWRQSTSWGDIVEEEPARPPGHGIHMHEKLSSPSRKSIANTQYFVKKKQFQTQSMAEVLAKKEELADRLEKANEEAIASAIAEEEQLTREIQAEENNDYNLEADSEGDFSEHLSLKKYIVDIVTDSSVPVETLKDGEEKQKARKKAKKLRARMNSRGKEYETSLEPKSQVPDSPHKAKLQRLVKDLVKQLPGQDSGHWTNNKVSGLDRTLGEISRILEKQNNADQVAFQVGGGLSALEQILQVVTAASCPNAVPRIPLKSLCSAVNTYYLACSSCQSNCAYVLFGNKITFLMDMLIHQLMLHVPDEDKTIFGRSVSKQVFEGLTTGLLKTTASVLGFLLSNLPEGNSQPGTPRISTQETENKPSPNEALNCRVQDLIR